MSRKSAAKKIEMEPLPGTDPDRMIALKDLDYRVEAAGIFARVTCVQTYQNHIEKPLEAVYVFPLPDEASVTACALHIGRKKIKAELKAREAAQSEYNDAVNAGHHAALLEQDRANVFTMNVGGIEPGEKIKVSLEYLQRIPWQDGGPRLTVPLVVAPRFIPGGPAGKQAGGWSDDTDEVPDASRITPVVAKGGVPYRADIKVRLAADIRLSIASPSHPDLVPARELKPDEECKIKLARIAPDRDFILAWRSKSREPELSVYTEKYDGETFMLAGIFPPARAKPEPAEVVFLLDVSGSMAGSKIEGLKTVTQKILTRIKDQALGHKAAIILFESQPHILAPLGEITEQLIAKVASIPAMGGTVLGPALSLAYSQFTGSARPYFIVLITDGQTESLTYQGRGARIIAVGIDSALNDTALRNLARQTGGVCEWFLPGDDFDRGANTVLGLLSGPVLTEVKVSGPGEAVGVHDVFEGRPAAIAVRYAGEHPEKIVISGMGPKGKTKKWTVQPGEGLECPFAPQLWAREFIRETGDPGKQEEASLKYGVLCAQTAFVAVHEKAEPGETPLKVAVPVSLPAGWSYGNVFGGAAQATAGYAGTVAPGDIMFSMDKGSEEVEEVEEVMYSKEPDPEEKREKECRERAWRAYQNGEYHEALGLIEQNIAIHPVPWDLLVLGLIQRRLDNLPAAIAALDKAIAINPDYAAAYYNRACYKVLSQAPFEDAIKDLETAIKLQESFRESAQTDPDFDAVRDRQEFKKIVEAN